MGKNDSPTPDRDQAARDAADALTEKWRQERLAREAAERAEQEGKG